MDEPNFFRRIVTKFFGCWGVALQSAYRMAGGAIRASPAASGVLQELADVVPLEQIDVVAEAHDRVAA